MIPLYVIEELAAKLPPGDPVGDRLLRNARLYPERRDEAWVLLQARARRLGISPGSDPKFGLPSGLRGDGCKLGDVLAGGAPHGDFRFSREDLPGNVGIFGVTGSGKSFLASRMAEWFIGLGLCVVMLDVSGEHCSLIRRFGPDRLLVIRARHFPLGVFVNPPSSCLSPLAWLSRAVNALRECAYLRDGACNLLLKVVGGMYRERGVFEGSGNYPTLAEVFVKVQTEKFSAQSRHSGFLESLINRFQGLIQSFPGMNAKRSLDPAAVCERSLIVRMSDLSEAEKEQFGTMFIAWLMSYREGRL